jgi:hypothetical protein
MTHHEVFVVRADHRAEKVLAAEDGHLHGERLRGLIALALVQAAEKAVDLVLREVRGHGFIPAAQR